MFLIIEKLCHYFKILSHFTDLQIFYFGQRRPEKEGWDGEVIGNEKWLNEFKTAEGGGLGAGGGGGRTDWAVRVKDKQISSVVNGSDRDRVPCKDKQPGCSPCNGSAQVICHSVWKANSRERQRQHFALTLTIARGCLSKLLHMSTQLVRPTPLVRGQNKYTSESTFYTLYMCSALYLFMTWDWVTYWKVTDSIKGHNNSETHWNLCMNKQFSFSFVGSSETLTHFADFKSLGSFTAYESQDNVNKKIFSQNRKLHLQ